MSLDAGAIAFSTKLVTAHAAGNNAGSELAQLKTRLTSLMKLAKDMSGDGSLDVKAKKELQKILQAEIQMLMQRIAELESAGQKGGRSGGAGRRRQRLATKHQPYRHTHPCRARRGYRHLCLIGAYPFAGCA
jgi:gas vesicle protein